jgi:hypothetical protein
MTMPQPATHYLVTRRAIPEEHWVNWWDKYKPYFGLGSSAPDLFYFPLLPEVAVKGIRTDIYWEGIANPLHSSNSYDMFCALLSKAKQHKQQGGTAVEKQFAFAFGYYCHVVTDCIFHPYVYRSIGDHWNTTDRSSENMHKLQELAIDNALFKKFYNKEQHFSRIQWECRGADENQLEEPIAFLLHEALQEVYPDCYPKLVDISSNEHPVHQAYSSLVQAITPLFEGTKIYLWGSRSISIPTVELRNRFPSDFFTAAYPNCPTLNEYTPEELFNFSSAACKKIFTTALNFWESDAVSAKEYFKDHSTHYLNSGNWNLDTGLPCEYNNYKPMRDEDSAHYSYKCEELKLIYATLAAEYNPDDFPS